MTDRELLELAAHAAGIDLQWHQKFDGTRLETPTTGAERRFWHPLDSDGDALRLAVELEISIGRFYDCSVPACYASWNCGSSSVWEPAGDDPCAATRRAIVRAAAEIGRAMP